METLDFSNGGTRSVTPCLASILGQYFAVGLDDGSVQVFEATSGASYKKVTDIPVAHGRVVSCLRLFSDDDHVSSAKNILVKDPVRRPDYPISTKKTNASQKNTKGNASDDEDAVDGLRVAHGREAHRALNEVAILLLQVGEGQAARRRREEMARR